MKVLVTGAGGQLGSEIRVLATHYPQIEFIFTDSSQLDITRKALVDSFFEQNNIGLCINCAAYTAVDKAESDVDNAFAVNAQGARHVASACARYGSKLIHISTDFVFDGTLARPLTETDMPNPLSIYGKSKREGEEEVFREMPEAIIIRTSWVYSSFGNNFVKTILRLCRERESLRVVFDQVGSPTYATDLASAILHIAAEPLHLKQSGLYHYSNEGVCSWYDFAIAIRDMSGLNTPIYPIESADYPTPAKRPCYSVLNKALFKKTFKCEIPYWRTSLERCMKLLIKK
ncbi:MAG: dTDP-4-dehydrorhamnose reductase [Chitinophagales bacterium]|nr:dTDP-4-dehydrorhamnose reductase [Chitinophagales bacterium]MDW8272793.1 dTDP-4-dehydrorhamnose reductase [Chitinophagales bacterium]